MSPYQMGTPLCVHLSRRALTCSAAKHSAKPLKNKAIWSVDADGKKQNNQAGKKKTLPKKDAKHIYEKLQADIREIGSRDRLKLWGEANKERVEVLPEDWQDILRLQYEEQMADLRMQEG